MARFGSADRECDAIEVALARRTEQLDAWKGLIDSKCRDRRQRKTAGGKRNLQPVCMTSPPTRDRPVT
jgi:hypothetical protein